MVVSLSTVGHFSEIARPTEGAYPIRGKIQRYNKDDDDSIGRTFFGSTGAGAASFAAVDPGDVFSGFVPADGGGQTFTSTFFLPDLVILANGLTGIETFGFVLSGDAGFFRVDLGQPGGPITFLDGQLAIGSSSITIPEVPTAVPEPSSVGLTALALGAVGLRRRRKATKAA